MEIVKSTKSFLLISIFSHRLTDENAFEDLKELKALVDTYGGKVSEFVVQRREVHDKGIYVGRGKLGEAARIVADEQIDIVVLNSIVKSGQIFAIRNTLSKCNPDIKVWDRADLILEIFSAHAHTAEAKLQIELASMRHMGPRIYGMGFVMSRQAGGIGTLGIGETNTELMKRHWRQQIKKVQEKLKKHTDERQRQLERRAKNGLQTVSIIGYTNAGKTSLFNALTGKKNIVQNALFVTLDSSVGKIFLPNVKKEIMLSDTIGFIRNLPTSLIDAFRTTLMESLFADLLLLVIDISDEDWERKLFVVENVLYELNAHTKKRIYIFNKTDAAQDFDPYEYYEKYEVYSPQFISVKNNKGLDKLLSAIEDSLQTSYGLNSKKEPGEYRPKRIHVE